MFISQIKFSNLICSTTPPTLSIFPQLIKDSKIFEIGH